MITDSSNVFYHGTSKATLMSIAKYGLLPRVKVEEIGETVVYPDYSKLDSVYLSNDYEEAKMWSHEHPTIKYYRTRDWNYVYRNNVILRVELFDEEVSRVFPDRNFYGKNKSYDYTRPNKFEYEGVIPPERISVMQGKNRVIPLPVYIERYKKGILNAQKPKRKSDY